VIASTIQNGLLVSVKTGINGDDPAEHDGAVKARGKARSLITSVCVQSAFGLLCPAWEEDKLQAAVREARAVAHEFNGSAVLTSITVNVIAGRIAADDAEAVQAINGEVRELLAQMERGLRNVDAAVIREAANKARALSAMLSPDAAKQALVAIEAARTAARQITKNSATSGISVVVAMKAISTTMWEFQDTEATPMPVEQPAVSLFDDLESE
jgi:hypothetical protein